MSYTNETNLQFSFTFYYYVYYLGNCEDIINPNKYNKPMSLPEKWQQLPILCLTFIAFLMNAITLFIFIFGEFTINHLSSMNEPKSRATSSILSKNKSKLHDPKNHIPPDMKLLIIPVIQNIIMFIADIGLMCRNWCICLITIARAEVVIWPLGSKLWQRILRNPRRFKLIFMIFFVISMIISAFKHTDYIGQLCYDEQYKKYSLWSEEYFWTYENFSKYMTFIVLPYQAIIHCSVINSERETL
ncbi:hypothetical protein Smp_153210 [Schistosoma mansoni]|uniref:hypothetical protein n=1 Tax=Schistosoma mansoni TaxID=6183 RepID=UPI0001A6395C|nr:hypothetical protein Smp_153210 [Schistosoma mansoni]|eukprot:XP_018653797.1 hypothetical protein Smp_153210 [Schistosoma mansoni]